MSKLIRWNTPFVEIHNPSIGLYLEHGKDQTDLLSIIVSPEGIDEYPKYIIHFKEVIEFKCYEEAYSPKREYEHTEIEEKDLCSYIWVNSPSIIAYEKGLPFIGKDINKKPSHYLLFGGDNIVEVVTQNEPEIEEIKNKKTIEIKIKV